MDDIKYNRNNSDYGVDDSASEETYEDIQEVTFTKRPLVEAITIGAQAYFGFLANLIESLKDATEDASASIRERQELQEKLNELTQAAKQDEVDTWQSISRITAHTSVVVYIYNGTTETFKLDSSSWDNSVHAKEDYDIAPWQYECFILRSETPKRLGERSRRSTRVKHGFIYNSGELAFNFSTLLKLDKPFDAFSFTPKTVPSRECNVRSTGKASLNCKASITRSQGEAPYSYNVVIILG